LSETAADLPHNETLAAIEAAPMLCKSVLVSPIRFSSSAIFMLTPCSFASSTGPARAAALRAPARGL
jgi:hypothetical protein